MRRDETGEHRHHRDAQDPAPEFLGHAAILQEKCLVDRKSRREQTEDRAVVEAFHHAQTHAEAGQNDPGPDAGWTVPARSPMAR